MAREPGPAEPVAIAPELLDRFARDWSALTGPAGRDRTLVAVSGGADSVALLLLLRSYLHDGCIAATVDHGLRDGSADEARAVARLCADRGIAHVVLTGPIPSRVGRTANLSARARALRYALLRDQALASRARWIATAHHADDQLETMVMRLNRGSGVGGMAGIRRREPDPVTGTTLVRPLLGWRRATLAALVADAGIVPVEDPSNTDDRFDRARLRKRLAGADWLDPAAAARSAAALGDADEAIAWMVERERQDSCRFEPGRAILRVVAGPAELRRRLVELCLRHVDPRIVVRGGEVDRLIARLGAGQVATLVAVRCAPAEHRADDGSPTAWAFDIAPPHRAS